MISLTNAARQIRNELDRSGSLATNSLDQHMNRHSIVPTDTRLSVGTQILLPASYGSLGDDALRAGIEYVADSLCREVKMYSPGDPDAWPRDTQGRGSVVSLDPLQVGKTGFLTPSARRVFGTADTVVVGADTISGDYLHGFLAYRVAALREAARGGKKAQLVNFSMRVRPTPTALKLLRSLPDAVELWARDSRSQDRAATLLNREVLLSPDIGALVDPEPTMHTTIFLDRLRLGPKGRSFVVLAPNAYFETSGLFTRQELHRFWSTLAISLSEDFNVVFLPHDLRSRPGDVALARQIVEMIRQTSSVSVSVFVPGSASEAKFLIGNSVGIVSARLHAAIGSLSSGVPCLGLEYLDKFSGQFEWFGELGQVLPLKVSLNAEAVAGMLRTLVARPINPNWSNPVSPGAIGWLGSKRTDGERSVQCMMLGVCR